MLLGAIWHVLTRSAGSSCVKGWQAAQQEHAGRKVLRHLEGRLQAASALVSWLGLRIDGSQMIARAFLTARHSDSPVAGECCATSKAACRLLMPLAP